MAQYQTFPDAAGDSRTLAKLKALKLPEMSGRDFLDVGCNEGFFCGFAKFQGASRSVGLDHSELFIERARQRFPACEFHRQGWDNLPQGSFDVILLASALHYADDQAALLHQLVERLSPGGVLVVELGIAASKASEWVRVQRGIDEREFPSMSKLREILDSYAWKWMGPSVAQDGDPVARHVIHISRRRPLAYLLLQPPAYGKTSIASRLFVPAGIPVVSGDERIALAARGGQPVSKALRDSIAKDFSPFRIDEVIRRIFDEGAGADLVELWAAEAGGADFALDAYVPVEHHAEIGRLVSALGYLPVHLCWDRVGMASLPAATTEERAAAFYAAMAAPDAPKPDSVTGFVDELRLEPGKLIVRGWAADANGALPERLQVHIQGRTINVEDFEAQSRPDVQRHLHLQHALVGFRATLPLDGVADLSELAPGFAVSAPRAGNIRLAARVIKALGTAGNGTGRSGD